MSSTTTTNYKTTSFALNPVGCGDCVWKIENGLNELKGVISFEADVGKLAYEVTYDPKVTSRERIVKCIEDMGYRLKGKTYKTVGFLEGMRLAFSRARAERRAHQAEKRV